MLNSHPLLPSPQGWGRFITTSLAVEHLYKENVDYILRPNEVRAVARLPCGGQRIVGLLRVWMNKCWAELV